MSFQLEAYSYKNGLYALASEFKLAFAACLLLIVYFASPITQLIVLGWIISWLAFYAKIPLKVILKWLTVISVFLFVSLPAVLFQVMPIEDVMNSGNKILFSFPFDNWVIFLSDSSIKMAIEIIARSLGAVSCMLFILYTTPFMEIVKILRKMKIPSIIIDLLIIMYKFIHLYISMISKNILSIKSRLGNHSPIVLFKNLAMLLAKQFIQIFTLYKHVSNGFAARGFEGEFYEEFDKRVRIPVRYWFESTIGIVFLITLEIGLRWWGW